MTASSSKIYLNRSLSNKSGYSRKCCIEGCSCTSSRCVGLSFYRLPQPDVSKEQDEWRAALINAISRSDKHLNYTTAKICSRHFEERCLRNVGGRRLLVPGSLPTLWMPPKTAEAPKPVPIPISSLPEWKEGCRIVDLWELAQQMNCKKCNALLDLNQTTWETRTGLASVLHIICQCGVSNKVHTSKKQTIAKMTTAYFINIQASISVLQHCGITAEQACSFLNWLGIPATTKVFDTVYQESMTTSPGETVTQLEQLATCQETQSVSEIENRPEFCEHPPQKAVDLLKPATTDVVLFGGKAPAPDMGTDGPLQHMNAEIQVDKKRIVEECQLHSDTSSDNKNEDAKDAAVTLDQSKNLLFTETAKETEVPVHICNPQQSKEYKVMSEVEDNTRELLNEIDKKSAEVEFGKSSFDTPAAVTDTLHENHEDDGSSILSSTSHTQQAASAKANIFKFRTPRVDVKTLIVNDACAPFKCSDCGARFGLERALKRHKKVHASKSAIVCKVDGLKNSGKNQTEKSSIRSEDTGYDKFNTHSQEKSDISENIAEKVVSCREGSGPSGEVSMTKTNELNEVLNSDSCAETEKDEVAEKQDLHCKVCVDREKSFKCSNCHAVFDTSSALEDHFKFHTDHKLFSCQDCSASFSKDKELKHHVSRIHRNKRTFSCPVCSVKVTTASSLKNHMRIHTGEKPFKCEVCEKMFTEKCALNAHMRIHSGNLPHVCSDCGKAFAWPSGLIRHRKVHTGQRPYSCQECRATFPTISNLNLHMRVHTDKRFFSCEICTKSFRQSGHLHRHIEAHKEKSFLCQDCGKTFSRKEYFDQHYRTHTGEKPYKCPSCTATFSRCQTLLSHMHCHTGERFVCEVCQKVFKRKQSLTLHQEIHSRKECLCPHCGKSFLGKLRLRAHQRIHSGFSNRIIKGRYTCKDCGMAFNYLSNLYRHKKGVHLRLKPHQCTICQKSFSQSNALKAHLLTHSKSDV